MCLLIFFLFKAYFSHFCRFADLQTLTSKSIPTNCELLKALLFVSLVLFVGSLTTLVILILRRYGKRMENIGEWKKNTILSVGCPRCLPDFRTSRVISKWFLKDILVQIWDLDNAWRVVSFIDYILHRMSS